MARRLPPTGGSKNTAAPWWNLGLHNVWQVCSSFIMRKACWLPASTVTTLRLLEPNLILIGLNQRSKSDTSSGQAST